MHGTTYLPLIFLAVTSEAFSSDATTAYINAGAKGVAFAFFAVVLGVAWALLRRVWRATKPKIDEGIKVGKGVVAQAKDKIGFDDPSDTETYRVVAEEMKSAPLDDGLWTKALALSGGDETVAKARYIKLRVNQLKSLSNLKETQTQPSNMQPQDSSSLGKMTEPSMTDQDIDEDAIYNIVANELDTGETDKGLWVRLYAEFDGDERKTKVAYIKQRAAKLIAASDSAKQHYTSDNLSAAAYESAGGLPSPAVTAPVSASNASLSSGETASSRQDISSDVAGPQMKEESIWPATFLFVGIILMVFVGVLLS